MKTYAGADQVTRGYYLAPSTLNFTNVDKDGSRLPGGRDARWVRVPAPLVLAAAPVLGGLFVVTLPFIGVGLIAWALARALTGGARQGVREIAATVVPPFVPGEAHLSGKRAEDGTVEGAAEKDVHLEDLEQVISAKRGDSTKR
ncbi:MAG: hypothetical protein ACXWK6_14800 [Myxococcaceae bacterium]